MVSISSWTEVHFVRIWNLVMDRKRPASIPRAPVPRAPCLDTALPACGLAALCLIVPHSRSQNRDQNPCWPPGHDTTSVVHVWASLYPHSVTCLWAAGILSTSPMYPRPLGHTSAWEISQGWKVTEGVLTRDGSYSSRGNPSNSCETRIWSCHIYLPTFVNLQDYI